MITQFSLDNYHSISKYMKMNKMIPFEPVEKDMTFLEFYEFLRTFSSTMKEYSPVWVITPQFVSNLTKYKKYCHHETQPEEKEEKLDIPLFSLEWKPTPKCDIYLEIDFFKTCFNQYVREKSLSKLASLAKSYANINLEHIQATSHEERYQQIIQFLYSIETFNFPCCRRWDCAPYGFYFYTMVLYHVIQQIDTKYVFGCLLTYLTKICYPIFNLSEQQEYKDQHKDILDILMEFKGNLYSIENPPIQINGEIKRKRELFCFDPTIQKKFIHCSHHILGKPYNYYFNNI